MRRRSAIAAAILVLAGTWFPACTGSAPAQANPGTGTWRLVRTPNPRGGPDAVSIMQTAEPARSDLDLAGLMLRCAERDFEVVVVLLKPFSPRARPNVKLTAGAGTVDLQATVAPPGTALALPAEATVLANGPWQSAAEVAIEVQDGNAVRGVVKLTGLGPALALLRSSCPPR